MSGMSATSVTSEYYTFYIDTGLTISLSHDPDNSNYISDYHRNEEKEMRNTAATHMALIDSWVQNERNQHQLFSPVVAAKYQASFSFICPEEMTTGHQTIELGLTRPLLDEQLSQLKERLCAWKAKHLQAETLFPAIKIAQVEAFEHITDAGVFRRNSFYVREDLVEVMRASQVNTLQAWQSVTTKALKIVEKLFSVTFIAPVDDDHKAASFHKAYLGYQGMYFTTAFIVDDARYASEVKFALSNFHESAMFEAKLIDTLADETKTYIEENQGKIAVTPVQREAIKNEVVDAEFALQEAYKTYGVRVTFSIGKSANYPYDWNSVAHLHLYLPLYAQLVDEASRRGPQMQLNGVSAIHFSSFTSNAFVDSTKKMGIDMSVIKIQDNQESKRYFDFDIESMNQENKQNKFYEVLVGAPIKANSD